MTYEAHAEQLRRYLGTWGFQTRMLDYDNLLLTAQLAFDMPGTSVVEVCSNVACLGKRERSTRVREAVRKYWPTPNVLLPAHANARKLPAKEAA